MRGHVIESRLSTSSRGGTALQSQIWQTCSRRCHGYSLRPREKKVISYCLRYSGALPSLISNHGQSPWLRKASLVLHHILPVLTVHSREMRTASCRPPSEPATRDGAQPSSPSLVRLIFHCPKSSRHDSMSCRRSTSFSVVDSTRRTTLASSIEARDNCPTAVPCGKTMIRLEAYSPTPSIEPKPSTSSVILPFVLIYSATRS